MNDQRFIELVNLYIDREITAAETAELEVEIQSNARRRAIYQQYCKLNHATSLVYESFRAQAAEPTKAVAAKTKIAKFDIAKRERRGALAYYAGGLAAAACVAFALVQFNRQTAPVGADLSIQSVAATSPSAQPVGGASPAAIASTANESHAQFANLRSEVQADEHYAALLQALRRDQQRGLAETQLKLLETPSLFDDGVFDSKQPGGLNQRVFRSQPPTTPQAEFTAFQFQR